MAAAREVYGIEPARPARSARCTNMWGTESSPLGPSGPPGGIKPAGSRGDAGSNPHSFAQPSASLASAGEGITR